MLLTVPEWNTFFIENFLTFMNSEGTEKQNTLKIIKSQIYNIFFQYLLNSFPLCVVNSQ